MLAPPLVVPAGAGATGCLRPGEAANCTEVLPPAPPDSESRGDVGSDCRWCSDCRAISMAAAAWLRAGRLLLCVHAAACLAPPIGPPSPWSEAHIADGSRRWISMIQSRTICPLARPMETKIVTSKLLVAAEPPAERGGSRGEARGSALPPAGFEMLDACLIRKEASLLLFSAPRSSTMVVHPHAALDGLTAARTGAEVAAAESSADSGSGSASVAASDKVLAATNDHELAVAAESNYLLNRWLADLMPSDEVEPNGISDKTSKGVEVRAKWRTSRVEVPAKWRTRVAC